MFVVNGKNPSIILRGMSPHREAIIWNNLLVPYYSVLLFQLFGIPMDFIGVRS